MPKKLTKKITDDFDKLLHSLEVSENKKPEEVNDVPENTVENVPVIIVPPSEVLCPEVEEQKPEKKPEEEQKPEEQQPDEKKPEVIPMQ